MQKAKFALLAPALLGLSSCAPIWPLSGDRANIPNYVASNVDPATCKPLKPTYWPARQPAVQRLSNDGDQALACAQLSVQLLTNRYNLEKHEIEAVRKASVVSLFGLGTTAGVNIAQDASKNQLQRLDSTLPALQVQTRRSGPQSSTKSMMTKSRRLNV